MTTTARPWNVVHCVFSVGMGGQEMVILSLATAMDRRRFAPRVLCLSEAGDLAPRFEAAGVPVDVLDPPVGTSSFRALSSVRRYLREHRPDILHTHNPTPHQYGALARLGTGVPALVHTKHGRNVLPTTRGRILERVASRLTDAVVAVSRDAADVALATDGVPRERLRVIRNGIAPGPEGATGHRDPWRAVHIARLNNIKDQATLLRAARIVRDREPRFRLDLVGDGELREPLQAQARELHLDDVVRFHGFQNDVWPFLGEASVFVLSSVSEGIAITLLEAMAAGLPVVATDVGGNSEVVVPGETGLLVPVRDPGQLADALHRVLSNPEAGARMGAAGRVRVAEAFSLDTTVSAYERLYVELLERSSNGRGAG